MPQPNWNDILEGRLPRNWREQMRERIGGASPVIKVTYDLVVANGAAGIKWRDIAAELEPIAHNVSAALPTMHYHMGMYGALYVPMKRDGEFVFRATETVRGHPSLYPCACGHQYLHAKWQERYRATGRPRL